MKTKDDIEKLISENLEALNENEPMEGHFDRFQSKLNKQKGKSFRLNVVWKVAAAVLFVLLVSNQAYLYFSAGERDSILNVMDNGDVTLATISPEYEEVEFYYTNAINAGLNQWNELNSSGFISSQEQQLMDTELAEFEDRFKTLQEELSANPNDDRVINAMLEYYQTKLSVISMIVNKLEEVKQTNINHDVEI